jgi:hypothetical protein
MQFADDFLEDSENSQEEEDASDDPASFFITGSQADAPTVPLQPAVPVVQLLPLVDVTRKLVSGMLSLSLFGDSAIGATISGTIYDLSHQATRAREKFATFYQDNQNYIHSEHYALAKSFDDLEKRITDIRGWNQRLKSVIRSYEKRIDNIQRGAVSTEISQLDSEVKAVASNLRTAIGKLQDARKEDRDIQGENEFYQEKTDELMKALRKRGGLSQRTRNLAKLELDLANATVDNNEMIVKMQNAVNGMVGPIEALKAKLADMGRRVAMSQYPLPVREPDGRRLPPTRRVKMW